MTTAYNKFYINGEWVEPAGRETIDVINPATEEAFATISMGTAEDVDAAAKAARAAFPAWSGILPQLFPGQSLAGSCQMFVRQPFFPLVVFISSYLLYRHFTR